LAKTARQDARRSGIEDAENIGAEHTLMERRCFFVFYTQYNNKIERGVSGT